MKDFYPLLKPLLLAMDAETAHRAVLASLRIGLGPAGGFAHPVLETKVFGKRFPNPLGLAAGFDKDAEAVAPLLRMGFGFIEAGTVTPRAQSGNPRPRVFRDPAARAVVNRMGFPGKGIDVFETHMRAFRASARHGIAGANIGINKDETDPLAAYRLGVTRLSPVADYITINVSSPNTVGLRALQAREELDRLLDGLAQVRSGTPLLLKVAPDLDAAQRADVAELVLKYGIDGLVVSNTTLQRPCDILAAEKGGLSGRPLATLSTEAVRDFYRLTGGRVPIVGVGGVSSGQDAYDKIRAGASLVQVYTALVFDGPALVARILADLAALLARDGFAHVAEAVGTDTGQNGAKGLG